MNQAQNPPEGWRSVDHLPAELPATLRLGDGERYGEMPGDHRHSVYLLLEKSRNGETPFPLLYWQAG